MTGDPCPPPGHAAADGAAEFAEELKLLAEAVLERVEPALRRVADGQAEWSGCDWCPVCAAAALLRGEHHELLAAVAEHSTAIVTVLREALAGAPVEPVMPTDADREAGPPPGRDADTEDHERSRYVGIPVTIKV
ncbi:hypothetical protein OHA40_05825 [Nocardia sp. NBC_00508]|uniref:hypothetical protein n=1 Tax=Nocardia sp. NBC_00508 TaxID=2975992 RepID=UPI002E8073F5|nr:hypothetical protein [Nocardia sp. NBC_00508]WUD67647.1 hypothetical protein OHA40_05825 [Nocardia sp. NBC_00508]